MEQENKMLKQENEDLKKRVAELEEHLKKYTAPARSKTYYENHKEELLEKMKKYKPTPEQIKEKNRKAYLKRKEKLAEQVV
jgi:cell division protein FtsB